MRAIIFLTALFVSLSAMAREIIQVGGYEFSPYVEFQQGRAIGLTPKLLALLNKTQDKYEFRFVPTAPRRRYEDLSTGTFDVMFFENPEWGWSSRKINAAVSREFLRDQEVFVTQAAGRDQNFFTVLAGKSIAGIYGYHYAFAGFNDDPSILESQHGMSLVYSHQAAIQLTLSGRVDMAIINRSFLNNYLRANPALKSRLLVSRRVDQTYSHRAMVRDGARITIHEIEALLDQLKRNGTLDKLWRDAGITEQ